MLNLECKKAHTNCRELRLRGISEHIKHGYLKVSENRTFASEDVRLSQNAGNIFYFQEFVDRKLAAAAFGTIIVYKKID
jgi:hypothetical protein